MNGQGFILWVNEQGGFFKAMRATREQYDAAVKKGVIDYPTPWSDNSPAEQIPFIFIAFGTIEDNYNRLLNGPR